MTAVSHTQIMTHIVQTKYLCKRFGSLTALEGLNLSIEEGETFALLGPNGAGKTTAIKLLTTLLKPSSGDAWIDGISITKEPFKVRRKIGYVPQMTSVDATLTGYENLLLFARLYDLPSREAKQRVNEYLAFMDLQDVAHEMVRTYSGGMVRRLEIAQSMMHRPKVLFLDEPTSGLDPIGVETIWHHLLELKRQFNTTILLSTHIMEEADRQSDRLAFLSRGRLTAMGTSAELKNSIHREGANMEDVFIYYSKEAPDSPQEAAEPERDPLLRKNKKP